jgi:hypothetical protein
MAVVLVGMGGKGRAGGNRLERVYPPGATPARIPAGPVKEGFLKEVGSRGEAVKRGA